MEKLYVSWN